MIPKHTAIIMDGNGRWAEQKGMPRVFGHQNGVSAVKKIVEEEYPDVGSISIETTSSDDIRSYHINSDKIRDKIGFVPKLTIEDAVRDLCIAMKSNKIPNSFTDDIYYNVKQIKKLKVK